MVGLLLQSLLPFLLVQAGAAGPAQAEQSPTTVVVCTAHGLMEIAIEDGGAPGEQSDAQPANTGFSDCTGCALPGTNALPPVSTGNISTPRSIACCKVPAENRRPAAARSNTNRNPRAPPEKSPDTYRGL